MNTNIENDGADAETFRNSRLLIAVVFLASIAGFVVLLCLAVLCLATFFPLHGYTLARVIWAVCYFAAAWFSWNAGTRLWRLAVGKAPNEATLDAEGVHLRVAPEKHADARPNRTQEQFVAWDQIAAIRHRRADNNQLYSVVTKDNRALEFDAFTFFRSNKLARRISARAGLPIRELE
jgi:type VI protein secretion system component VasK